MKRKLIVRQHDSNDCAPACLAMILLHYGKQIELHKLKDLMHTQREGTYVLDIVQAAEELGFIAKAVRVDKEGFQSNFTLPAIAQILLEDGQSHFVVIKEIYQNKIVALDPAKGKRAINIDEFFNSFTGLMILMVPDENIFQASTEEYKEEKVFWKFLNLLKPHKLLLLMIILASILITISGIVTSFFSKYIFDDVIPYNLKSELIGYIILFMVLALIQIGINYLRSQLGLYVSQKMDISLVLNYFKHIFNLPLKFFSTKKTGDILTRFGDSNVIKIVLTNMVLTVVLDVVLALATGIILYKINKSLFLIIIVITVINTLLVYSFKSPFKKYNMMKMQQDSKLSSTIVESINAISFIKSSHHEKNIMEKIEREFIQALKVDFKMQSLGNLHQNLLMTLMTTGNFLVIGYGAYLVIDARISIGVLLSFVALSSFFMDPINRLVGMQLEIQEADISMKRLTEIMNYKEESFDNSDKVEFTEIKKSIDFNHVTFNYRRNKSVVKDLDFVVNKGEKTAIVGVSGSGKSTIAKLILGLYSFDEGNILIDNISLKEYDLASLRSNIGYVQQDVQLLPGTVMDNIRMGNSEINKREISLLLNKLGCPDFFNNLNDGAETFIEESGIGLSGGEKQVINLVRALITNPELVILDEATSNMDVIKEKNIFKSIYSSFSDKTFLIIAHKLNLIKNCNKILVVDKGKVVETGNHEELLALKGVYCQLWNEQEGDVVNREIVSLNDVVVNEETYENEIYSY